MSDKDHRNVAAHVLKKAHKVVTTERGNQHGGAEDSFLMIGHLWETYLNNTPGNSGEIARLGIQITAYDVAQMMTLLKVARAVHGNPLNEDNYVDAAGYQSLAAAIAGVKTDDQMVEENATRAMAAALAPRPGPAPGYVPPNAPPPPPPAPGYVPPNAPRPGPAPGYVPPNAPPPPPPARGPLSGTEG